MGQLVNISAVAWYHQPHINITSTSIIAS